MLHRRIVVQLHHDAFMLALDHGGTGVYNVAVGERSFLNYDCLLLDCGRIEIGARTMFGPAVRG